MSESANGSNAAKAVHPFVEQARRMVIRGSNIYLAARSVAETESQGTELERRSSAVTWFSVAEGVAGYSDVDVIFLDFTANERRSMKLAGLAESAQRTFRSSLLEPFNIWQGDWLAVFRRLLVFFAQHELWWPDFGFGESSVALQEAIVLEVCRPPLDPPRSSTELLERLGDEELPAREGLSGFSRELFEPVIQQMLRGAQVFDDAATELNGPWAWKDAGVAYVSVAEDERLCRDTLGQMLVLSLAERLEELYRQDRSCIIFFDAHHEDISGLKLEPLFGAACASECAVVLLPETTKEMELFRFYRNGIFPSLNALEESLAEAP